MRRKIFITAILVGVAAIGTYLGLGSAPVEAQTGSKYFSHASHYGKNGGGKIKDCGDCHSYDPKESNFGRPGHNPCVTCHTKEDFTSTSATSDFCKNCHSGTGYSLREFPDPRKGFVALENFSHKSHLDTGGKTYQKFGKVSCDNCHDVNKKDGTAGMPTHKECGQCHGDSAGGNAAKPNLTSRAKQDDCLGCHSDARKDETVRGARPGSWEQGTLGLGSYDDELIFYHQKHLSHPGAKQACKECHEGVEDSTNNKVLHLPTMFSCEKCHKDSGKVTNAKVMDKCETCHKLIKKGEKPQAPKHYGRGNHQAGAKRPTVYCAYCHTDDPAAFPIKEKYKGDETCAGCHKSEGVPWPIGDSTVPPIVVDTEDIGTIKRKNGYYATVATAFDFKQIDNVAVPLDQLDAQDADLFAIANFDAFGIWKENFGVSFLANVGLDAGFTPAFSPFADQFSLDQQARDDRGQFDFDNDLGGIVAEDFDRTQTASVLVFRAFGELKNQPLGKNKADIRVGRQSIFDAAEPWIFFDGGDLNLKFGKKSAGSFEVFAGNRASPFTKENQIVDEIRPLAGVNFAYTVAPKKAGPLTLKLQDVFLVANSTRAALDWRTFPNLNLFADFKAVNFVPDQARAGFLFFNPTWGTQLFFNFRHKFDNTNFSYDYTTLDTRGGADILLADPTLQQALAVNAAAQDAFDQFSAERAALAEKKVGKLISENQISDFENFNLLPEFTNDRFTAILSQKIAKKVFLNFEFDTRLVNAAARNNALLLAQEQLINTNAVDQAELAVISDVVAEDNRFAFTYPFIEFAPGIDFYDVGVKGLHISTFARIRLADPNDDIPVQLLFSDGVIVDDQISNFGDISGESDNLGVSLVAEAVQVLGNGKIRLGASLGFHRYDYVGRYVVTDANGDIALTANNGVGEQQFAGIVNLNGLFGAAFLRLKVTDKVFVRAQYTAETDLQFFPDDPFIASDQIGFGGGNQEFASSDIVLLQRALFTAGINF